MKNFVVLSGMILGTGCAVGFDDKPVGDYPLSGSSDSLESQNGIAKAGSTPPRGPAAEGMSPSVASTDSTSASSAGTSASSSDASASSDSTASKGAGSEPDSGGSSSVSDATEAVSAATPTASDATSVVSSSTDGADSTVKASSSESASEEADPALSCPGDNPNSIVKIYGSVGVNADAKVSYFNLGYSTCADPAVVIWAVPSGPYDDLGSVDTLSGVLTLTESRVVGTKSSSIYQLIKIAGVGSSSVVSLPSREPAPAGLISGNHSCTTPATSIVVVQKNADNSIKQFCLVAGAKVCTCPTVIESTPVEVVPTATPVAVPTGISIPSVTLPKFK